METTAGKNDLTQGVIWKKLLFFFLPILAGSLFQQLYSTVDAVIVGRYAGKEAMASIDAIYNLLKLPVNFFTGLSVGITILISQYFGSRDYEKLSKTAHMAIAFALISGIILSVAGFVLTPFGLSFLKIPADIYSFTMRYARIYFSGMIALMIYNVGSGILRSVGDSKTPFYILVAANIINVILDLLFIAVFKWHVTGAALATVISQAGSAGLILIALVKTDLPCKIKLKAIKFSKEITGKIFRLGLPVGVQSALYPIANMVIQSNINSFGTDSIAAWAVCGKLDFMIWIIADSFGSAVSIYTAQNYGAKKYRRSHKGVGICLGMTAVLIAGISVVLYLWCTPLSGFFINDNEVIRISTDIMRFMAPLYVTYVFGVVLSGAIRGYGETLKPMIITLFCTCVCRILWILFVVDGDSTLMTVLWSYPVSWIVNSGAFIIYYFIRQNTEKNLTAEN